MASTEPEQTPPPPPFDHSAEPSAPEPESTIANFECNICLDTAKDAVITLCGHLFCWPCLHQWLEVRAHNRTCPVCKAACDRDKVIPLYGRGSDSSKDPRDKAAPPRPAGQRTEPSPQQTFMQNLGFDGPAAGFQFSTFAGFFPFGGIFTFQTNAQAPNIPEAQLSEDRFLSTVMALMGLLFLLWIILV